MKKQFNHILDINGKDRVFPVDKNCYALFFTEDSRFFIYALYTKRDFKLPALIEVDFDSFMALRSPEVVENVAKDLEAILTILIHMKQKTILESMSVGQILELDKN